MNYKIEGLFITCNECKQSRVMIDVKVMNEFMDEHDEKCHGAIVKKEKHAH